MLYLILLCIFILSLAPSISNSVSFRIKQFQPDANDIIYEGDAKAVSGVLYQNTQLDNYTCHIGRAIYAEKVRIWESKTGKVSDFTTHFTFTIDTLGALRYGHGLAFFLAPVGFRIPPNSVGGFFGLFNTTTTSNKIVHVEFDARTDPAWDPPNDGHVGINIQGLKSAVTAPWNASLHSGNPTDVWITYNATTTNLSVVWSYQTGNMNSSTSSSSSISYLVDLRDKLPEWAITGLTASVGVYRELNQVNSWEFQSSLNDKTGRKISENKKMIAIVTGVIGAVILLVIGSIITWKTCIKRGRVVRDKSRQPTVSQLHTTTDLERGGGPRRFSFGELALATNNFSLDRKVGEGGFGDVYRGFLENQNTHIAVKKITKDSRQGKKEYTAKVKIISRIRHRNLVQLVGWCHDEGEFMLVYEFMPNGSLDSHLFRNTISPLPWPVRYRITVGLASALLYLHEECEQCVLHRDIKASNMMLDSNFDARLGDFGLAKLVDHNLCLQTTGVAGTFGYMAPEYIATGKPTKESDVYSFGVVILEIVSGRKSMDLVHENSYTRLIDWIRDLHAKGNLLSAVDEKFQNEFKFEEAEALIGVGLWCVNPDPNVRPSMRQVNQVLQSEHNAMNNFPLKRPIPMFHAHPSSDSVNYTTNTTISSGR